MGEKEIVLDKIKERKNKHIEKIIDICTYIQCVGDDLEEYLTFELGLELKNLNELKEFEKIFFKK